MKKFLTARMALACLLTVPLAQVARADLFINPSSNAARWVNSHGADPRADLIRDKIAKQPMASWFTTSNIDIEHSVDAYVGAADKLNQVPVMVAYNIPDRDCGGASQGGAPSSDAYRQWITSFAQGIKTRAAVVILEPDALPSSAPSAHCFTATSSQNAASRVGLIAYAVEQFNHYAPKASVYLDAGNSFWIPAATMASILVSANIQHAHGFSLNVSNFKTDEQSITYGKAVNAELKKQIGTIKPFVIDSSRNGNGPPVGATGKGVWCDPQGRKLGATPVQHVATDGQPEMKLWIKLPGNTDGCAGPIGSTSPYPAGTFSPEIAYGLIQGK